MDRRLFVASWTGATALGWLAALLVVALFHGATRMEAYWPVDFALAGATLAALQALALRRPGVRVVSWTLAGAAGAVAGGFALSASFGAGAGAFGEESVGTSLLAAAAAGAALGIFQCAALSRAGTRIALWPAASALGWTAGVSVLSILQRQDVGSRLEILAALLLAGAVCGGISALPLAWILGRLAPARRAAS